MFIDICRDISEIIIHISLMSLKNVTFWYMFSKSVDFPLRAIMEGQKAYFSALSCLGIFSQNTLVSMRSDVKLLGWNSYVQSGMDQSRKY